MEFKIGKINCSPSNVVILAEAGVNHLGELDLAEKLIKSASEAGSHIIKFQTYKADDLTIKSAPRFWDWDGEQDKDGTQHDSYSTLDSFGKDEHIALAELCKKYDIEFMSTPFSDEAAEMLYQIGVNAFKVASCDITNIPFLKNLAGYKIPILLSTGAATIQEINEALAAIKGVNKAADICIMQCTLCYPTDYSDANLNALKDLKKNFPEYLLGLSDHTLGYHIPLAGIPLGARIIEKHFTIDKTLPKSADHWLSIDHHELAKLCEYSEQVLVGLGSDKKQKLDCEDLTYSYARRSVVSTTKISKGTKIERNSIACKRPGTGIPPADFESLIGAVALNDIEADTMISMEDIDLSNG